MKKKIILMLTLVATIVCLFTLSVSADTIVPSTSNEYGELTIFDEAIGNTNISQLKNDRTVARTVLFDGTNYYTVPTTYVLTESTKTVNGEKREMFLLSFGEIGSKLGKTFNKNSIIRIEIPSDIYYIANGNENLSNCNNVVEIIVNDGLRFWGNDQSKAFTNCKKLKSIDLSGMVIEYPNNAFALLEYCAELEYVKLPTAYYNGEKYVNYDTNHMFSGCNKLARIDNLQGFFQGVTSLGYKTFYNCHVLPNVTLWPALEMIEGRAFGYCKSFTEVIIPENVKTIGSNNSGTFSGTIETVFENCTSLKKIVFPSKITVGNYCFEKCTALESVWMPQESATFGREVFGQCGTELKVTFYFTTGENNITINDTTNKTDPFITALNREGDPRIQYNTPASTKCTVFFGNHAYAPVQGDRIAYPNGYDNKGEIVDVCTACADKVVTYTPALFVNSGVSVPEGNQFDGIAIGFLVNKIAIQEYCDATGKTVKYGVFVVLASNILQNDVIDENGEYRKGVIGLDVTGYEFSAFELKVVGFSTDEQKKMELVMGAYVALTNVDGDTEYSYLQSNSPENGEKYYVTSFEKEHNANKN